MHITSTEEFEKLSEVEKKALITESYRHLHKNIRSNNLDQQFGKISGDDFKKIYGATGSEAPKKENILTFCNLARKMDENEFVEYMVAGELPPIKLTPQEMSLVAGGLKATTVCASAGLATCGLAFGLAACGGIMLYSAYRDSDKSLTWDL